MRLAVFYHSLIELGDPPSVSEHAVGILCEQISALQSSGLLAVASEFIVGINGGDTSREIANLLIPAKATVVLHGVQCKNELRTILLMEEWAKTHPNWILFYHHAKNCTHTESGNRQDLGTRWRWCMQRTCVERWQECVAALKQGYEAVGAHWMTGQGSDHSQSYFAGNFFYVTSNFFNTLPSIMGRERIRISGLDSADSRYEAEVKLCLGSRLPRVKDMETSHRVMCCP